ncbi:MAG: hypothetical protein IKD16_03995, partial [Bacteroidales bacterium]|nr:hypothetical protein [Bacteroidales bacterium]
MDCRYGNIFSERVVNCGYKWDPAKKLSGIMCQDLFMKLVSHVFHITFFCSLRLIVVWNKHWMKTQQLRRVT